MELIIGFLIGLGVSYVIGYGLGIFLVNISDRITNHFREAGMLEIMESED